MSLLCHSNHNRDEEVLLQQMNMLRNDFKTMRGNGISNIEYSVKEGGVRTFDKFPRTFLVQVTQQQQGRPSVMGSSGAEL